MKSDDRRMNDEGRRTVRRQKGERKSDDRRTNGGDRTTVRRQDDDDKRTETRQRGVIRKFASHSKSVHKMLKPPTYDGQSSWSMYRRQFEAAAKANGWTSQEMATSLVLSLRGQALDILQSIPEEQQNDYDRIVGALEIRQQRSNESLQEYEADIERLVHLAYPQAPKEFLEQIGIQTFIDRLLDTEMQQALRLGRHTTISDALIAALEFKAAKEASRCYKTRGQIKVSVKNELTRSTARFKIKIQESRQKEVERRKWDIEDLTEQDWSFPYPRPKTSDERSLVVHGYLDDKWCSFVIDTGATRTILRPDILPKSSKELFRHVKLETATGELIPVHGELNVKIQLGSKIIHHRILTADIRDDCILGLDILSKHGFVVDVKNRIIQIQNEEIVMAPKLQDYNKSRRIIVEEDIQIPQGSENIIIAKLDGNSEGLSIGMVEDSERYDGVLVARSLVQMDNQIPVRIANISDKKIILKKNEVLGRCEPVEKIIKCEEVNQAQTNQARVEDEWSSEELKKSQKKDSDLKLIRNWGYWAQWSSLCLRDGLLHRKWESPDGVSAVYQLVLPKARIHQVLEELHSSPSGGHFGVTRTLARDLRERMDRIHRFAREKLKIHSDKMKQRLDTTSTETAFKPGDAVWLYAPKRTKGKSPKLQSNREGPHTIIKKINDLVYRFQLSPRSKPKGGLSGKARECLGGYFAEPSSFVNRFGRLWVKLHEAKNHEGTTAKVPDTSLGFVKAFSLAQCRSVKGFFCKMEWTNDLTIEFLQMYEKELMNATGCKKEQESELYYEGIRSRAFAKSSHSVGAKRMPKQLRLLRLLRRIHAVSGIGYS
ncbi:hypothetical protein NQ318_013496 [Aromia moschata]|uniref:Peptidase A2 domain-containing protein n=1 Tax=Aromia moschata TaxID=1265417 RepID=A0AAV8YC61_9CUCU|nr:hypothetical protein NQ318_013496 [Aromia moschata]